ALDVVLPAAEAKDIEVLTAHDDPVGPMLGDPDRLQQVLWNLLSNAVKFTQPGGTISVRVRRAPEGVAIEVKDDGIGIDPELLPYVFDRFRQGDSHLGARRGLGLGLAIARHLVELHGGSLAASSAGPGAGAAF